MRIDRTNLGELYGSLSPLELKQLGAYLEEKPNEKVKKLHSWMVKLIKDGKINQTDNEFLMDKILGSQNATYSSFTTLTNLLSNHIKDYLLLSKIHEKNIYTEALWGEILIERRLKRNLLLKLTNFKFDLYKDSYALMKKFFHERENFFFQYLSLSKKNYSQMVKSQVFHVDSFLYYTKFYLLEIGNSLITLSKQINYNIDEKIIYYSKLASDNIASDNELIKIQALCLNLSLDHENESYYYLKAIFKEKFSLFSDEMRIQLYPVLINYGTRKLNKGIEEYEMENYQIFLIMEEGEKLFQQGFFSVIRLFAYIRLELRFGTIKKADYLLEESLKVIAPNQKDSFQYLIESRIAFAKKDYTLSLRKISTINPADSIYYYPQYKIMLIKCYIMLADIDRLMAERENFYKYIASHKNIQEDEKRRHKLYIKYTEYLTEARYIYLTDYMKKRIEQALLQTSPYFTEKQWVRERWEELKQVSIQTNE